MNKPRIPAPPRTAKPAAAPSVPPAFVPTRAPRAGPPLAASLQAKWTAPAARKPVAPSAAGRGAPRVPVPAAAALVQRKLPSLPGPASAGQAPARGALPPRAAPVPVPAVASVVRRPGAVPTPAPAAGRAPVAQASLAYVGLGLLAVGVATAGFLYSRYGGGTPATVTTGTGSTGKRNVGKSNIGNANTGKTRKQRNANPGQTTVKAASRQPAIRKESGKQRAVRMAYEAGQNSDTSQWSTYWKSVLPEVEKAWMDAIYEAFRKGATEPVPVMSSLQLEDDNDGEWSGQKTKVQTTPLQRLQRKQAIKQRAIDYLEGLHRDGKTICVFLDYHGNLVADGFSGGLAQDKVKKQASNTLSVTLVKDKSQQNGFGGLACAEPHALYKWRNSGARTLKPAFSLAYDCVSEKLKPACGTCDPMLDIEEIEDLYFV